MDARPDFRQSVAVVIGIDAYDHGVPPLRTAAADARRLGRLLADDHGYDVRLLLDERASREAITGLLADLGSTLGTDDRVLFYFAGHGVALEGDDGPTGYLLPQDARRGEAASYLHMPALNDALNALPCRHLLVVLDSCFSGAFRWSSTRDLVVLPEVIHQERYDRFILDPAWQALASASHDQTALDALPGTFGQRGDAGGHSPFAQALFDALAGAGDLVPASEGDGVITASELYLYLEQAVQPSALDAGHRQTPRLWPLAKHDKGEFIFLVPGHALNLPPAPPLTYDNNPWRGLESYDEAHADLFFGRDGVVEALAAHVEDHPLSVVLGASGTGKSSVVKAGLVPRLKGDGAKPWHVLPIVRPGAEPVQALERAVAELEPSGAASGSVEDRVAAWCRANPDARLMLVVDQVEELVTMTRTADEREAALGLLLRLVEAHPSQVRVVLTLRSDFEPQFDRSVLGAHWSEARYVVPPMTQDEIRAVIERPASERVMYFEPHGLVDALINEVVQTPGGLPLLSFALSEMYIHYIRRQSDDRALTDEDYRAVGGVVGALRTRADAEVEALDPAHRESMRRLMLRMVSTEGGGIARRRVPRSELIYPDPEETARVEAIVARLTKARLVVEGREDDGEPYVEPAHDALVRAWDRLLRWIHAEQGRVADLRFQHGLAQASREWGEAGSPAARTGLLWRDAARGGQLAQLVAHEEDALDRGALRLGSRLRRGGRGLRRRLAGRAAEPEPVWMNRGELAFARRSLRRRTQIRLGLAALMAMIVAGGAIAVVQAGIARQQRDTALSRYYVNQSDDALGRDPVRALVFAIAAATITDDPTPETQAALFAALQQPRVVARLSAHRGWVWEVAFDTSGARLLTTGGGVARVWDTATGALVAEYLHDENSVGAASLSPDGTRLTTMAPDSTLQLWTVGDGAAPLPLRGDSVTWALDSGRLVTLQEGVARIWDADTGQAVATVGDSDLSISTAVFAAGGRLVTASRDGLVQLRSSDGVRVLAELGEAQGFPLLAVSPDGDVVATSSSEGWRLWSVETGGILATIPEHSEFESATSVAFSPDGDLVALSFSEGITAVWSLSDREFKVPYDEPREDPTRSFTNDPQSVFDATGQRVVSVDADGQARVWAVENRSDAEVVGTEARVVRALFSPAGPLLIATEDGSVQLWDLDAGPEIRRIADDTGGPASAEASPDGRLVTIRAEAEPTTRWWTDTGDELPIRGADTSELFTDALSPDGALLLTREDGRLRVWDTATGRERFVFSDPDAPVVDASFSPDGARIVLRSDAPELRFLDAETGRPMGPAVPLPSPETYVQLSPDGRQLLIAGDGDQRARLVTLATGRALAFPIHAAFGWMAEVVPFAFSPDGSLLAAPSDGTAAVWETDTGRRVATLPELEAGVEPLAFSPDGTRLLTVSDRVVRVWDWRAGRPVAGHSGYARQETNRNYWVRARFSPDGTRVLSESTAREAVYLWDAATGRPVAVFGTGSWKVERAVFGPSGDQIVATGEDGTARVYSLAVEDLLRIAEARLAVTLTDEERQRILDS